MVLADNPWRYLVWLMRRIKLWILWSPSINWLILHFVTDIDITEVFSFILPLTLRRDAGVGRLRVSLHAIEVLLVRVLPPLSLLMGRIPLV